MTLILDPHQQDAHQAFVTNRRYMLLDDPGCGKTPPVVTAADFLGAFPALVVCPLIGTEHWRRHFIEWCELNSPYVQVVERGSDKVPLSPCPVVIVPYDLLALKRNRELRRQLMSIRWEVLIVDECHRAKHCGANRTKVLFGKHCDGKGGLVSKSKRVWELSGTLAPNHFGEVWTHLHALFPRAIWDNMKGRPWTEDEFQARYCETEPTRYGPQIVGSKNAQDLKQRIKPHLLRRRKRDVIKDMPPLRFNVEPLPMSVLRGLQGTETILDKLKSLDSTAPDTHGWKDSDVLAYIRQHGEHLATYRRLTGLVKVPLAVQWCEEFLNSGKSKLLIFGVHHEVLDSVYEQLTNAGFRGVQIDGRTSKRDRDHAEHAFQTDPHVRFFAGQIRACGEVITLTAAADVAFVEIEWTPEANHQAACRAHRRGQNRPVTASILSLPAPWLDMAVNRTNARKANELSELFNDDE